MKPKKIFRALSCGLAAITLTASFAGCSQSKSDAYLIGSSGPLTGAAAKYGIAVQRAAQLAVEEINASLGEGETKYSFKIYDDKAATKDVPNNFARLYEEDGMQMSLGAVTTGSCIEYKKYATDAGVFCLAPSATGDDVTKNADNMLQMCFSDSNQGVVTVDWMVGDGNIPKDTKIGIFYCSNDAYSTGIYNKFKERVAEEGYEITAEASFNNDADGNPPSDFSSQVQTLKNCKFIFMPIYYTPAATFMTAAQKVSEIGNDVLFIGCDGFDGIDSMDMFDVNTIKQEISMLSHFDVKATSGKTAEFVKNYKKKYNGETPIQFGASAYDCIYALKGAIDKAKADGKEVPANISAKDLNKILQEVFLNGYEFSGVTGSNIKWNKDGTVNKKAEKVIIKTASK